MRSAFFAFNVAVSGMNTARNGSNTTVHNMSNLSTPGFSRQQAIQRASMPLSTYNRSGMVGTGSEILGIRQIRNPHLDTRYRNESPVLGHQATLTHHLTLLETSFGEVDNIVINNSFNRFFNAQQDLHTYPANPVVRNNFLNTINILTQTIQDTATALRRQQSDINREIAGMATVINTIGDQIATLNDQIQRLEIRGDRANDLRDQRNLLIDELSRLVNIDVSIVQRPAGEEKIIHINGHQFVSHDNVMHLETVRRDYPLHPHDAPGMYDLRIGIIPFRVDNRTFSGELRGLFEMRDGNVSRNPAEDQAGHIPGIPVGGLIFNRAPYDSDHHGIGKVGNPAFQGIPFKGIPYYIARLNDMVRTFSNAMNFGLDRNGDTIPPYHNGGHVNGYNHLGERVNTVLFGFDGMNLPPGWNFPPGHPDYNGNYIELMIPNPPAGDPRHNPLHPPGFLLANPAHPQNNINIFNFNLNIDVHNNHDLLATATHGLGEGGESEADLIMQFMALQHFPSLFREGTINDFLISVTAELAMDLEYAQLFRDSQAHVLEVVHNMRLEVKGVDMNEEMTNMIFFQHHFQAASRMISAINDIYENMIMRMGV